MSRPVLALILLVIFYAVAFGLRTWQHLRATGSTGFRGISGRPGSVEWLGGVLFAAGIALSLAAAVGEAAGWVPPLWEPGSATTVVGIIVTLIGIVATYVAQVSMGDSWRIGVQEGERTELRADGPFAWCRNPIFTGMLLAGLGMAAWVPLAGPAWLALWLGLELQVRVVEEPHLLRIHGASYRAYAARTGRFWPGLGRGIGGDRVA